MLEQVRKNKVRYNLFLGPPLPFLKWMYVLALLAFLQIRTWPCHVSGAAHESMRKVFFPVLSGTPLSCNCFSSGAKFAWLQVVWGFFLCPVFSTIFPISAFSWWLFFVAVVFLFSFLFLHLPYLPAFSIGKCQEPGHVGQWSEPGLEGILQENIRRGARDFHPQHLVDCITCEEKNPRITPPLPNFHL